MPALITHYQFANQLSEHAPAALAAAIAADSESFLWGAQGPDPLFFFHPLRKNPVSQLGHAMHYRQIAAAFSAFVRNCAEGQNPSALAYLLGFCCHYALDRTVHPFVTYQVNYRLSPHYPMQSFSSLHHLYESELDRIVLETRMLHGDELSGRSAAFRAYRLLTVTPSVQAAAAQLFGAAAQEVYHTKLSARQTARSLRSMLHIMHVLHNPTGLRARGTAALERIIHSEGVISSLMRPISPLKADCTNCAHGAWIDAATPHIRRYESVFDLMDNAERTALLLMTCCLSAVRDGTRLPPELFSLNYLGLTAW